MSMRRYSFVSLAAAVLWLAAAAAAGAQSVTVTFLHLNDLYEISPKQGKGGYAPLMTLLKQEREKSPNTITTFGGDLIGSSMMSGITKGTQMIELMNAIGLDMAVAGNHEFDFGPDILKQRVAESKFTWLGTNMTTPNGAPWAPFVTTAMRTVGGIKIGFMGLITPDTIKLSSPGPTLRFTPFIEAARAAVAKLKADGADAVVAVTHLDIAQDRQLGREVKGINVIMGGHDYDPITFYEGDVFIFKVGHDAQYLGAADIQIDKTQGQSGPQVSVWPRGWRVATTAGAAPDPAIAAIVKKYEDQLGTTLNVVIGKTSVELDSRRATARLKESNVGNLVADAMRDATKSDIAITNGGGLRGDRTYAPGTELTRKDILTELPFGNLTTVTEVTGADVKAALENGVSQVEDVAGKFPQVSGLKFTFDARLPKGARVLEVTVGGKPLDPAAKYRVATNEFMMAGGDGYDALSKGVVIVDASGASLMANTVMDYVAKLGTVAPAVEGRVVERK